MTQAFSVGSVVTWQQFGEELPQDCGLLKVLVQFV